jgi:5-methylcytosine-specific restriction protein A
MPHRIPSHRHRIATDRPEDRHREYNRTRRNKQCRAFYHSAAWLKLRGIQLRRHPFCEVCQDEDYLEPATVADHRIEISRDWSLRLTLSNLRSLCASCHSRRHARKPNASMRMDAPINVHASKRIDASTHVGACMEGIWG